MPPSLLILTHEYLPKRAGIATYVSETALSAWEHGWDVTILAPSYAQQETRDRFRVIPTKAAGRQDWLDRLRMRKAVLSLDLDWDDVTLWLPEPGPQRLWMYAKSLRLPTPKKLILTLHGSEILRFSSPPWRRRLFSKLLKNTQLVSVVSEYTKSLLVSRYGALDGKIEVIYGAVRQDLVQALESIDPKEEPSEQFVVLTLARIHPRKAQDRIIEAMAALPEPLRKKTTYRLVGGIGRKAYSSSLQTKAQALDVKLEGPIEANTAHAVATELRNADVMILASKEAPKSVESFGLVYLEAAAAGCPVIATESGGVSEAISDKSGCILKSDTPEVITRKLEGLHADRSQLAQWRNSGPEWAANFSWAKTAKELFGTPDSDIFEAFQKAIKDVEILSLDVFDTCLQRVVWPKEVFAVAEQAAVEEFGEALRGFAIARWKAEKNARQKRRRDGLTPEVNLEEIYASLVAEFKEWSQFKDALLQCEIDTEHRLTRRHPKGFEMWQHARALDIPVVFVSDMYLGAERIKKLLEQEGYESPEVLCSSDFRHTKHSGALFPLVSKQLGVPPEKILHVGDNFRADVGAARKAGFKTLHISPPSVQPSPRKHLKEVGKQRVTAMISNGLARRRLHNNPADFEDFTQLSRETGYQILGPLALGYCQYIVEQSTTDQIDLLLCLSRDGHLPYKILSHWKDQEGILSNTRIEYFYSSRRAVCLATLAEAGLTPFVQNLLGLWGHSRSVEISAFMERLGLRPEDFLDELRQAGFDGPSAPAHSKLDREKLQKLLELIAPAAIEKGDLEKADYSEAINGKGMEAAKNPAIVDLGWKGSQQKCLQLLYLRTKPILGYYVSIADSYPVKDSTRGYLVDEGQPIHLRGLLEAAIPILETLFSSPDPPLEHYEIRDGQPTPVFHSERPNQEAVAALHEGAMQYVKDMDAFGGSRCELARADALNPYLQMILNPSPKNIHYWSLFTYSDALGEGKAVMSIIPEKTSTYKILTRYSEFFESYTKSAWRTLFIQEMPKFQQLVVLPLSPSFRRIWKAIRKYRNTRA